MPPSTTLTPAFCKIADDQVEILPGAGDGQSAQAIVSAESHDHQHGFQTQCVLQAVDSVFGGVSADPFIHHLVVIAHGVQVFLQVIGIAVARVGAEAGGETVAESDNHRAPGRSRLGAGGGRSGSRGGLRCRGFRSVRPARSEQGSEHQPGEDRVQRVESTMGHKLTLEHFPYSCEQPDRHSVKMKAPSHDMEEWDCIILEIKPRTRISCHAPLDEAARASFSKERRMKHCRSHQVPQEIWGRGDPKVVQDGVLGWAVGD